MESYQAHVRSISSRCVQLDRVCMCVRLRHARILCICGLYVRVYLCVFICFFIRQRIMLMLLQTLCLFELFMCTFYVNDAVDVDCWLLMLAGDFAAAATATATTENTNAGCVCRQNWLRLQNRFLLNGEKEEKTIKNHIHLKRKIQIQWISAVACCYINQNPIYLSCRRDWFNGICIDRCFITFYCSFFVLLIWLAQWSSKFHFSG